VTFTMTKTKLAAITLAAIMVVGTLGFNPAVFAANPNANEASPANGGTSNGLPFQNLDAKIDALKAEVDALTADTDANIAAIEADIVDLQSQIDALSTDIDTNIDAITDLEDQVAVLENILGVNCGTGAIRAILSDGTVLCISINESETLQTLRVVGPLRGIGQAQTGISTVATCPAGWTVSGGGFDSSRRIAEPTESFSSGNGWFVTWEHDRDFRGFFTSASDSVRSLAQCMRVL